MKLAGVRMMPVSYTHLDVYKRQLQSVGKQYLSLFDVQPLVLNTLPRKTNTFCEIKPYAQVFEIIVRWFRYGEYSLEKERLILQVKTLDKLFEYYCLLRLLKLLADNGYQKANVKEPVFKFDYVSADEHYQNEKDVANTYLLSNGEVTATLYYHCLLYTSRQLYSRYKTAPTEEEREQARQEYLDRRGVPQSYHWTVPPWEL